MAKRDAPSAPPSKGSYEAKPAGRTGDRSHPRGPRTSRKQRGGQQSRRPRSRRRRPRTSAAASLVDKSVRDERFAASRAGEDSKGSLRDKCKNCYIGVGPARPSAKDVRAKT